MKHVTDTKIICPNCYSLDGESWDKWVCQWCGRFMVEGYRLTPEEQARAWTQMTLVKT